MCNKPPKLRPNIFSLCVFFSSDNPTGKSNVIYVICYCLYVRVGIYFMMISSKQFLGLKTFVTVYPVLKINAPLQLLVVSRIEVHSDFPGTVLFLTSFPK